jgi:Uma2 family endonuclease
MARTALTLADYDAVPNDGRHYQILDGELFVTATPNTSHQRVVGNLFVVFHAHVRAHRLGEVFVSPVTVILADTTVVEPDIVFVGSDRLPLITRRGIAGAPTLLVEVLSPSTSRVDRTTKFELYARYGVAHYWIVDADARTLDAYALRGTAFGPATHWRGDGPLALSPFENLALDPAAIWT